MEQSGLAAIYDDRAEQLYRQDRYADLKKWSAQMLAEDPDHIAALMHQGNARVVLGDWEGVQLMEQALARDPENADYHRMLALVYCNYEAYETALRYIDTSIALHPTNSRNHYMKGQILSVMKRFAAAIVVFEETLRLSPDHAGAFMGKAYSLVQLKRHAEAQPFLEKSLELEPNYGHFKMLAASIYYDQHDYQRSITMMEEQFAISPGKDLARYTHLMAHHTPLTSVLFRPETLKIMDRVTVAVGLLALVLQLLAFNLPTLNIVATIVRDVAYACVLHLVVRGFLTLFLVLRLAPRFRETMLEKAPQTIRLLRAGVMLIVVGFVADVSVRQPWSHLLFLALLHAFLLTFIVRYSKLLTDKEKRVAVAYAGLLVPAIAMVFLFGVFPVSGILVAATAYAVMTVRPYLLQVNKELLGFDKWREGAYSY